MTLSPGPQASKSLKPQKFFNKDLETVAALNPADKAKKYTNTDLRHLRDVCYFTEVKIMTSLPNVHKNMLSEGRTKRGTNSFIKQELCQDENSDDPGLIYVFHNMFKDINV